MALVVGLGGQQSSLGSMAPQAPQAPKAPRAPKANTVPSLDQTALANIAAYINKANGTIGNDLTGINNYRVQLQNALSQDRQANQLADLKMMTAANAHGGFYGTPYGQQLGNQNTAYQTKESGLTDTANANISKLTNAIAELNASIPLYSSQQAAASTARQAALAAKTAPAATTTPTAPGGSRSATPTPSVPRGSGARIRQLRQRGTPMGGFR